MYGLNPMYNDPYVQVHHVFPDYSGMPSYNAGGGGFPGQHQAPVWPRNVWSDGMHTPQQYPIPIPECYGAAMLTPGQHSFGQAYSACMQRNWHYNASQCRTPYTGEGPAVVGSATGPLHESEQMRSSHSTPAEASSVEENDVFLFFGTPGTGKSTTSEEIKKIKGEKCHILCTDKERVLYENGEKNALVRLENSDANNRFRIYNTYTNGEIMDTYNVDRVFQKETDPRKDHWYLKVTTRENNIDVSDRYSFKKLDNTELPARFLQTFTSNSDEEGNCVILDRNMCANNFKKIMGIINDAITGSQTRLHTNVFVCVPGIGEKQTSRKFFSDEIESEMITRVKGRVHHEDLGSTAGEHVDRDREDLKIAQIIKNFQNNNGNKKFREEFEYDKTSSKTARQIIREQCKIFSHANTSLTINVIDFDVLDTAEKTAQHIIKQCEKIHLERPRR